MGTEYNITVMHNATYNPKISNIIAAYKNDTELTHDCRSDFFLDGFLDNQENPNYYKVFGENDGLFFFDCDSKSVDLECVVDKLKPYFLALFKLGYTVSKRNCIIIMEQCEYNDHCTVYKIHLGSDEKSVVIDSFQSPIALRLTYDWFC